MPLWLLKKLRRTGFGKKATGFPSYSPDEMEFSSLDLVKDPFYFQASHTKKIFRVGTIRIKVRLCRIDCDGRGSNSVLMKVSLENRFSSDR